MAVLFLLTGWFLGKKGISASATPFSGNLFSIFHREEDASTGKNAKDFIKWEELPCALAPDMEYDGQGCFSGTAVEHEGKHILMYTSVLEKDLEDGTHMVRQTQSIAIGDGENYEKVAENPVIIARKVIL